MSEPATVRGKEPNDGKRMGRPPQAATNKRLFPVPDGGHVEDASPWSDLSHAKRMARIEGLLMLAASYGDISAAKELRAHERWRIEMSKGKAPQRVAVVAAIGIEIIDSISGPPDPELMAKLAGLAAVRGRHRLGAGELDEQPGPLPVVLSPDELDGAEE